MAPKIENGHPVRICEVVKKKINGVEVKGYKHIGYEEQFKGAVAMSSTGREERERLAGRVLPQLNLDKGSVLRGGNDPYRRPDGSIVPHLPLGRIVKPLGR